MERLPMSDVREILRLRWDLKLSVREEPVERAPIEHENVRGPDYYH